MEDQISPLLGHLQLLTYAGKGEKGRQDALRTNALINKPHGIFCDPNGDIYITELRGNRIIKINGASNTLVAVAGTGFAGNQDGGYPELQSDSSSLSSSLDIDWSQMLQQTNGDLLLDSLAQKIKAISWNNDESESTPPKPLHKESLAKMKHEMLKIFSLEEIGWLKPSIPDSVASSSSTDTASPSAPLESLINPSPSLSTALPSPEAPNTEIKLSPSSAISELGNFVKYAQFFDASTTSVAENTDESSPNMCSFDMPEYVVGVGPNEFVFSDYRSSLVRRYMDGKVETIAGKSGAGKSLVPSAGDIRTKATFSMPRGGCVAPNGNLYLADFGNNRIVIFDVLSNEVRSIGTGKCVCVDGVGDFANLPSSSKSTDSGSASDDSDSETGIQRAGFASPYQLILRRDKRSFFLAEWTHIRWISYPDHLVRTYAGSKKRGHKDGPRASAQFCGIVSILETPDGRYLLASEYSNNCIRIINAKTGIVSTIIGGRDPISRELKDFKFSDSHGFLDGPIASSHLESPMCMTWNHHGDLLIADSSNHAIRIVHGLCDALLSSHPVNISPMASYLFENSIESILSYFPSLSITEGNGNKMEGNFFSSSPSFDLQHFYLLDHFRKSSSHIDIQSVSLFDDLPNHKDLLKGLTNQNPLQLNSSPSSIELDKTSSVDPTLNSIWSSQLTNCIIANPFKASEWIHPGFAFLLSLHRVSAFSPLSIDSQYSMKRFKPIGGSVDLAKEAPETVSDLFMLITGHARCIYQTIVISAHQEFSNLNKTSHSSETPTHFFSSKSGPSDLFIELWSGKKLQFLLERLKERIGALLLLIWRLQLNVEFAIQLGVEWTSLLSKTHSTATELDFQWTWDLNSLAKSEIGKQVVVSYTESIPLTSSETITSKSIEITKNEEESGGKAGETQLEGTTGILPWSIYMTLFRTPHRIIPPKQDLSSVEDALKEYAEVSAEEIALLNISPDSDDQASSDVEISTTIVTSDHLPRIAGFRDDIAKPLGDFVQSPELCLIPTTFNVPMDTKPIKWLKCPPFSLKLSTFPQIPKSPSLRLRRALDRPKRMIGTRKRPADFSGIEDDEPTMKYPDSNFDLDLYISESTTPLCSLLRYLFENHVYIVLRPETLDASQVINSENELSSALSPNLFITCDDVHYIHCHDWVLSMKWRWISTVLSSGLEEANSRVISLSSNANMSTKSLALLIQFLYTNYLGSNQVETPKQDLQQEIPFTIFASCNRVSLVHFLLNEAPKDSFENLKSFDPGHSPQMALLQCILEYGELLGMFSIQANHQQHEKHIPALSNLIPASHTFAALLEALRRPFNVTPKTLAEALSFLKPFSMLASTSQYRWLVSFLVTQLSEVSVMASTEPT